jgi:arylformamidase
MNLESLETRCPSSAGRRRALLAMAGWAGGNAAHAAETSAAGAAPLRTKGPIVLDDMDAQDLADAFDIPKSAPNLPQLVRRFALNSDAVRRRLGPPRRLAYGPTDVEAMDIYRTSTPRAPVQVLLHGGVFNRGSARDFAFAAELFVHAGAHLAVLDFARAQDVDWRIEVQADQVRRALLWVHRHATEFGGDPDRIFICGHSSGAELAAMALSTDWRAEFGASPDVVKGGLCCSATYDLRAFRHSAVGRQFAFTDATEQALSPMRHLDRINVPLIVAVGSLEAAFFKSQSMAFAEALRRAGKPAQMLPAEGYNHFEVIETLANPYGLLGRAVLAQMGLGTP